METIWCKKSIAEEQPTKEVVAINTFGEMLVGYISYDELNNRYICESEESQIENVIYWLKETDLELYVMKQNI